MAGLNPDHAESLGSQHEDPFQQLEQMGDREGSVHSGRTAGNHPQGRSKGSSEANTKAMQREIDQLKRKLRRAKRKRTPSISDPSSDDSQSSGYNPRSGTPPSETFSYQEGSLHDRASKKSLPKGLGSDAMGKALHQLSKSPFTRRIEKGKLPRRFTHPNFTIYNGRTDPVEHMNHFNQRMTVYSQDEALMCKVFPSSLGPVAMRWFNGLKADSIDSYMELTMAFGSRFVTCSRVPRPLDSLLSMAMREGETLKTYSDRYWEAFNEIDGDFDEVAVNTFKVGLPVEHDLRKSLTKKPVKMVRQLMDRIDEYKRVEEDQQQSKGKMKIVPQESRDFKAERYNSKWPRRDFTSQTRSAPPQTVNAVFCEPVQQVLEKICREPYFRWPNRMIGDPTKRNQNLYCHYHQDKGHATENCRNLWIYLDQLVKEGKLRQFMDRPNEQGTQSGSVNQGSNTMRPPLGTINVIFAAPGRTGSCPTRVMSVWRPSAEDLSPEPKKIKKPPPILGFSEEDKLGTIQPHDDTLVITLRIGGYDVKRVMVDQGSGADIMYPDLFKGLNLRPEDLTSYDSPLISFERKAVIPKGIFLLF